MTGKKLAIGGGIIALVWGLLFLTTKAQAKTGSASTGGGAAGTGGPSNESGIPAGVLTTMDVPTIPTPSPVSGLSEAAARVNAEISAEINRIYNSGATAKNKYDWIASWMGNAAAYRNSTGVSLPSENEAKAMLDNLHSAAYPSFLQKQGSAVGGFVLNKIFN